LLTAFIPIRVSQAEGNEETKILSSCIAFVRAFSFWQPPQVERAIELPVNSDYPRLGGWALFSYRNKKTGELDGHSALVIGISTSSIIVLESNFISNTITRREISLKDPYLRGFWSGSAFVSARNR